MLVPVHVPDVAVEVVKAPLGRVAGPFLRVVPPALQPILSEVNGMISHLLQGIGKVPVILNGLVELHVAHIGMPLVHPRDQGGPGWSTDRRGTVVPVQNRPGPGHLVQLRGLDLDPLSLLLEENSHISIPEIVRQDEDDVGLLSPCQRKGRSQNAQHPDESHSYPHIFFSRCGPQEAEPGESPQAISSDKVPVRSRSLRFASGCPKESDGWIPAACMKERYRLPIVRCPCSRYLGNSR